MEALNALGLYTPGTKPNTYKLTLLVKAGKLSPVKISRKTIRYLKSLVDSLANNTMKGEVMFT